MAHDRREPRAGGRRPSARSRQEARAATEWLIGGGELGALIRSTDWSATSLGPRACWPQPLRTVVQMMVESQLPMCLLWGPDLLMLYNDGYRAIAAGEHPGALGRARRDLWPQTWHLHAPIFEAVMRDGVSLRFDDGSFTVSYSPVRLDDGAIAGTLVAFQETRAVGSGQRPEPALQALNETLERRVAERTAHLRERDELLRALTDNSPDPIYVKDAQSRWLLANPAVLRIVGKTAEEAIGKTDLELHRDPSIGQAILENDRRIMSAGRAEAVEEVADSVEGRRVYLSIKAPWPDGRGGIAGIVGISRDITERKRVEEELRNANALLTEADRRKDAFLASLSHELRNPLAPIANSLYVLDHAAPGGEQADRAKQVICRQVLQLSNLVNDLLDVTRIARGKATLQKERLELNEVVRRAVEDNRSLFDRAGVRLELASEACAIRMVADRTRIVQIVGNLLQNSAKFTHRGGRTRVSVAVLAHQAVVRVVDDGVGIAPETVALLFQPFTQAAQTLDRSRCGLGLGLALVKGLVELHGGTVSAHSEGLGCGTEMVVRLPVEASTALQDEESPSPVTRCRRRVLIIEDNADTAASLSEVLGFGQHEVAIAHDGPDGLAQARAFRPDVVLCDIGLPGMSGYDVARVFREDEELRGTVLVALSGYALPEDVLRAAEAGFACHLAKPPSLEKLEALLASLPAESASASTASRGPPASA